MSEENTPNTPGTPPEKNAEGRPAGMSDYKTNASEESEEQKNTLEKQLDELQKKQAEAAVEQVDSTIKELDKLIADRKAAEESYAKVYPKLKEREAGLKTERDTLSSALKAALGDAGVEAVKRIITEKANAVSAAESARDTAKSAVESAQRNADVSAGDLAAAQAKLDVWRKPGDSIGNRLAIAEGLIEEIKKLRNAGGRGEAYWKLALGRHADIPGQEFLNLVLSREPKVIHPDDLRERIRSAWDEHREARTAAARANATLAAAQDELKEREDDFADKTKNLIKTIAEALAEREAASDAA